MQKKWVFWNFKGEESTHSIGTPKRHIYTMPATFWYLNEENRLISSISFGADKKKGLIRNANAPLGSASTFDCLSTIKPFFSDFFWKNMRLMKNLLKIFIHIIHNFVDFAMFFSNVLSRWSYINKIYQNRLIR